MALYTTAAGQSAHKKKSKQNSNPLRTARGGGVSSGELQRAQDIWFRKSATGVSLFLHYYHGQPLGTVVAAFKDVETGKRTSGIAVVNDDDRYFGGQQTNTSNSQPQVGMSRAARRKRKRKSKFTPSTDCSHSKRKEVPHTPQEKIIAQEESSPTTLHVVQPGGSHDRGTNLLGDSSSPLWSAWKELQREKVSTLDRDLTNDTDMEAFAATMSRRLPVSIRIRQTANKHAIRSFEDDMLAYFPQLTRQISGRNDILQAQSCSKVELSSEVRSRLVHYSESGVVARQELGSMLPVLALEHHIVRKGAKQKTILDMCASPGSKTLQALECLCVVQSTGRKSLLIANDIHNQRLEAMKDAIQRSRVSESCTSDQEVLYSCQDARKLAFHTTAGKTQLFDVILCDVPCSGDGTCRKDRRILPQWKPDIANSLHATQLAILRRGLALLKPGGRLCYSTCSLNPVENEAVVAAALHLETTSSNVKLVDIQIEGIQLRNGLTGGWRIAGFSDSSDTGLRWLDPDEREHSSPDGSWPATLWPPKHPIDDLARTKRLLPQDHDSGGFFLALFHKPVKNEK